VVRCNAFQYSTARHSSDQAIATVSRFFPSICARLTLSPRKSGSARRDNENSQNSQLNIGQQHTPRGTFREKF